MNEQLPARFLADTSDSKTAKLASDVARPYEGAKLASTYALARDVLRSEHVVQAGHGAERIQGIPPEHLSVFFLDGAIHKKRRGQIARFFTPKAMTTRYHKTMEASTARLIERLRKSGREQLDLMSFELACEVTAEIVGLTESKPCGLALRVRKSFFTRGIKQLFWNALLLLMDVRPAIAARRKEPREDVLSLIVEEGYSLKSMFSECQTYGSAGMVTTREFIVAAAWHLFEKDYLREQFLTGGEAVQFAILDEVLRIDPVVTHIHRWAKQDFSTSDGEEIKAGELYALELRSANLDETVVGENPERLDPERAKRQRMTSSWMSFGDGPHRCPGAQVALHETRIFLDALLRVPGIRLASPPVASWTGTTYELHGAYVECDRV